MKVLARALPQQSLFLQVAAVMMVICCLFNVALPRAHAAELTADQKQAILNLLASFGADQVVVNNVSEALGANVPLVPATKEKEDDNLIKHSSSGNEISAAVKPNPIPEACRFLEHLVKRGDQGEEVSRIQDFLKNTGDFTNASTTGYFGPATERALQLWQARTGIVSSGDAETTGFGVFGPKTRGALVAHCRQIIEQRGAAVPPGSAALDPNSPPSCILRANKSFVASGEKVVLVWESKNATYTSSANGEKGALHGSIEVTPTVSTTYIKKVYGPGGESQCTKTIEVRDTAPVGESKVVSIPGYIDIGKSISLIGSGVAAVFEAYISLFNWSD